MSVWVRHDALVGVVVSSVSIYAGAILRDKVMLVYCLSKVVVGISYLRKYNKHIVVLLMYS